DRRCESCEADLCDSCQAFTHARTCPHAEEEGRKRSSTAGGDNSGKHAPKRASSSGAVGCGGRHPAVTKRQKRETDEIFASLTLEGTELKGDLRTLYALDRVLGVVEDSSEDTATTEAGAAKQQKKRKGG
ncbi:unnamed protein product, partial [Ectocarpus sp. 8 AP-2014]